MSPRRAHAVLGRAGHDPGAALREHLIDTAEKLLAERQVSSITTRDIARTAGVSDGVLYNYFADKHELVVAALDLVAETLPVAAGLMSEPALLHRFIAAIHQEPFGPHRMRQPIADYLAGEKRLGRLRDVDVDAALALVMGPAIMLGFTELMSGTPRAELTEEFHRIVHTLLAGLLPR